MSDAAAKRRAQQTLRNLVLSLLASIGVMLLVVFVVPRDDSNRIQHVDYQKVGEQVTAASNVPLVIPQIPEGWWANSARWKSDASDGVATWYVGFVGPKGQYIGLTQGFQTNPTWLALEIKTNVASGNFTVGNRSWTIYENPVPGDQPKTRDYMICAKIGSDDILLYGTASEADFKVFANSVNDQILKVYQ
ncbi:MAG: DUF4245 domain-containing protein [Actinomycetes bacterium]